MWPINLSISVAWQALTMQIFFNLKIMIGIFLIKINVFGFVQQEQFLLFAAVETAKPKTTLPTEKVKITINSNIPRDSIELIVNSNYEAHSTDLP